MKLSNVFQASIYTLVCLSGIMLALAEGAALPQGLTVPFTLVAVFFTERWNKLRLSTTSANMLGVVAFLVAGLEFFSNNIEGRLLSGAHLLVYLSWIVLFQKKSNRQYWWMCALGLLQVAVGAVLTHSGIYGLLLIGYFFLAIWTLSVFSLYQARQRFSHETSFVSVSDSGVPHIATLSEGRKGGGRQQEEVPFAPGALWRSSQTRGSIQLDPHEQWISWRFALGTIATASGSVLIATFFFMLIPRLWIGGRMLPGDLAHLPGRVLTGFTEEVRLGDFGEILESTERVLEMSLFDQPTGQPLMVEEYATQLGYDEPLFRGTVMGIYRDGRWSVGNPGGGYARLPARPPSQSVRQEIELKPIGTEFLFAIHPVLGCRLVNEDDVVGIHQVNSLLVRSERRPSRSTLRYTVYSPRPTGQAMAGTAPVPLSDRMRRFVRRRYRQFPSDSLSRLTELTQELVQNDEVPEELSDHEKAQKLVWYLRDSGEYAYTLDMSIQDATLDPVEDFLFNRKQGHCEYFASALTLMLRSVDIPARLVSGFKGGRTNRFTRKFEVEQRHAHAWVEAYIDDQWVTLDATPSIARSESVNSMAPRLSSWHELKSFASEFWTQNVVNMNFAQQQQQLYDPIREALKEWWALFQSDRDRWSQLLTTTKNFLASPEKWISWQGGAITFILLFLLCGFVWIGRYFARFLRTMWGRLNVQKNRKRIEIEFYERFRRICAAHGLLRRESQTQREFADTVEEAINRQLAASGLTAFPGDLVESFYAVRFGTKQLSPELSAQIDLQLTRLEESLFTDSRPHASQDGRG